jgi:hypothetical protein
VKPLFFATSVVLAVALQASATPVNTSLLTSIGSTTVSADSSKITVRAVITTRKAVATEVPAEFKRTMTVKNAVEVIDIRVNGHPIFVPPDAYCWLFNPNEAELDLRGRSMTLSILGGDAGSFYVVKLYFDSKRIKRKTIGDQSGIGSDTKYYFHVVEDVPAIEPDNGDAQRRPQ